MSPCTTEIARGIALDCDNGLVAGYTGRAVYIPYSVSPTITKVSGNPRLVSAVTSSKVIGIYTPFTSPFDGSNVAGNADSGRAMFAKSLNVVIPMHGADVSKDLIEPLVKSLEGGMVIVERKDKAGYGSYVVYGSQDPMKADPTTFTRNEGENGGGASLTLMCKEDFEEVNFFDTDYATTKAAFDALFTAAI